MKRTYQVSLWMQQFVATLRNMTAMTETKRTASDIHSSIALHLTVLAAACFFCHVKLARLKHIDGEFVSGGCHWNLVNHFYGTFVHFGQQNNRQCIDKKTGFDLRTRTFRTWQTGFRCFVHVARPAQRSIGVFENIDFLLLSWFWVNVMDNAVVNLSVGKQTHSWYATRNCNLNLIMVLSRPEAIPVLCSRESFLWSHFHFLKINHGFFFRFRRWTLGMTCVERAIECIWQFMRFHARNKCA